MKRLLLDTHVILWWLADDRNLGEQARALIAEPGNDVVVSAASIWELSIKRSLGKLFCPDDMSRIVEDQGFTPLPITLFHAEQAGALPRLHADPFDRMLLAQAQAEGLILLTADRALLPYGVGMLDATQ